MKPRENSYLYTLSPNPIRDIYTYVNALTNVKVIIGPGYEIIFDKLGNLIDAIPFQFDMERDDTNLVLEKYRSSNEWQQSTIQIRRFWIDGEDIGIYDYPIWADDFPEAYDSPQQYGLSLDEAASVFEALQAWIKREDYVFVWGNDYEVNRNGNIVAS